MLKTRTKWLIALLVFVLAAEVGVLHWYCFVYYDYGITVGHNWPVDLPRGDTVYSTDSGPSVLGDGLRYNVIGYDDTAELDGVVDWVSDEGAIQEGSETGETWSDWMDRIMDELEVPEEYRPDRRDCLWWYISKNHGGNHMVLCRVGESLYITEHHT